MCNIIHSKNEFIKNTTAKPYPTLKTRDTENYYSALANEFEQDTKREETPINETDILKKYGMLDSGTTGHFIAVMANVTNIRTTTNALNIIIPNGNTMVSTHECNINWLDLPEAARTAHIIPQLKQQSFLSVVKLCDAGCTVKFEHDQCTSTYDNKYCCVVSNAHGQDYDWYHSITETH